MQSIDIVGAGIAGLTLAAALDPTRWQVTLHEERPDRPQVGTSLGMWPAAMQALAAIGADDAVRARGVPLSELTVTDGQGRQVTAVRSQTAQVIDRPRLMAALREQVPDTVTWRPGRVDDPDQLAGDVVVGADGVHSAVRRAVWGRRAASRRTGHLILRGVAHRFRSDAVESWHRGELMGRSPMPDRRTNWYLAMRVPAALAAPAAVDALSDAEAHEMALTHARPFEADAAETVEATSPDQVLRQQLWVAPARLRLVRGRVVLIGDAAHAMPPNLGRGACESLVDAVSLARALNEEPVDRALALYQRERSVRTQAIRAASGLAMRAALMSSGARLRDAVVRTLPTPG